MECKLAGNLKSITIKQGKADAETGGRDAPVAVVQLEVDATDTLGRLALFVGQSVRVTIKSDLLAFEGAVREVTS